MTLLAEAALVSGQTSLTNAVGRRGISAVNRVTTVTAKVNLDVLVLRSVLLANNLFLVGNLDMALGLTVGVREAALST